MYSISTNNTAVTRQQVIATDTQPMLQISCITLTLDTCVAYVHGLEPYTVNL